MLRRIACGCRCLFCVVVLYFAIAVLYVAVPVSRSSELLALIALISVYGSVYVFWLIENVRGLFSRQHISI